MIINVYDVAHGFCAYVRDSFNGANSLFDCGYNELTGFHPVNEILGTYGPIGNLTIQNFDEDHLDGLPNLIARAGSLPAAALFRNPSLSAADILSMKERPYGAGLKAALELMSEYTGGPPPTAPANSGECWASYYWNPYPTFTDTNNLSLVTFVHTPTDGVLFAGDLEKAGWQVLLKNANFRNELRWVTILIASHHGRGNGYCEEIFEHCHPEVVIISDRSIEFDSQTEACYARHARGISWNGGAETRYVLTTRCDGNLRIAPRPGFRWFITATAA